MNILHGASILSDNVALIGKGLCAGKGLVIKQDWCLSIHVQGHDLRFSLADLQSYLLAILAETACLLLHVLICVRQQCKVVDEVKVLQGIKECPSSVVRRITQSITRLKRAADMTIPWRTPVLTWKFGLLRPTLRVKLW